MGTRDVALDGRRQGRRWRFGAAILDEASWTLCVDGRRIPVEAKPMELLHELLLRSGDTLTKDELLDAVWPGVAVVEASIPTAIAKLRRALGDDREGEPIIETVPRVGYRLAVPVEVERAERPLEDAAPSAGTEGASAPAARPRWRLAAMGVAALVVLSAIAFTWLPATPKPVTRGEVMDALRRLDDARLRDLLARGWDLNAPLNRERVTPIQIALEVCEWNPAHDKQQLMFVVRTLLDNGARLTDRNVWGDTAYSIAKARRYCGPDHPVTLFLHRLCYGGHNAAGDACLARYAKTKPAN